MALRGKIVGMAFALVMLVVVLLHHEPIICYHLLLLDLTMEVGNPAA